LNCKYSYEILMTQLNKNHSEIRYSAIQIIDAIFLRSHVFRELVLDNIQTIFELVLGFLFIKYKIELLSNQFLI
jgi:hypothetical protein